VSEPSLKSVHRELFVWLAARPDVIEVHYQESTIVLMPTPRTKADGAPWQKLVRVQVLESELAAAWPYLQRAAVALTSNTTDDLPELAAFSLLAIHLDHAVNSTQEPGPGGYSYRDSGFVAV